MKKILLLLLCLAGAFALEAKASETTTLRLVYGSSISGETLPCG